MPTLSAVDASCASLDKALFMNNTSGQIHAKYAMFSLHASDMPSK